MIPTLQMSNMKALFIYNKTSGKEAIFKKRDFVISSLKNIYSEVDVVESISEEHFIKATKEACGKYDALIFSGGDGTFNMVANAIAEEDNRPILGVIPTGTVNDAAKNFGVSHNIKKALRIIKSQKVRKFDIGKLNDKYFVFTAAIGAYADIPLITTKKEKKRFGPLAYYFRAFPKFFKWIKVEGKIEIDGVSYDYKTPFVLIMNSTHVGGFKINPKSDNSDGKMDVFTSRPSIFNSLLNFLFFRKRVKHYQGSLIKIKVNVNDYWDIDGEKGPQGDAIISVLPSHISIYCKK